MATIVHFDISADNVERAKKFYEQLFQWKIEKLPGPTNYYMIATSDITGKSGVGGGMASREGSLGYGIVNYFGVESIDAAIKQVAELGGKILTQKQAVPGFGFLAVCSDTENNVFGIFEEKAA